VIHLKDKTAIVTGASRGIGLAIAQAFAKAGAKVVIASRKPDGVEQAVAKLKEAGCDHVYGRTCHVGSEAQIAELVQWTTEEVGLPDVAVANAGTNPYFGPMLATPETAWDKTFEVNLKGAFWLFRDVSKGLMKADRPGSLLSISSVAALGAAPLQGTYGMTKASLVSMTQTLAFELGPRKIRVNAIAPGLIDTKLSQALVSNPAILQHFEEKSALKRIGEPEEIASAALYLASDAASFVTGQTIAVDGGFSSSGA
jgi:NAD(P)-dependent dehydrogenase (short-subunit alcohol dehydrogenase family)